MFFAIRNKKSKGYFGFEDPCGGIWLNPCYTEAKQYNDMTEAETKCNELNSKSKFKNPRYQVVLIIPKPFKQFELKAL